MATYAYTFTSGDTVTPTKLNNARTVSAIQTADISDAQITEAKLAANAVSTAKISDASVTNAKLATGIDASKITTGTLPIDRIADDAVTDAKLSLAANAGEVKKALNADNSPPIYACRAWVNFDGTRNQADTGASANGFNVKIRSSGNVASVLKNGVGDYTITFTTAMPDAGYAVSEYHGSSSLVGTMYHPEQAANNFRFRTASWNNSQGTNGSVSDFSVVTVAVFR